MSRTFKGYASAHRGVQLQPLRLRRRQVRNLWVDFNGAMEPGRTITSVTWRCNAPWVTVLGAAAIDDRAVSVSVTYNYAGLGDVIAEVTLDDGTVLNYEFAFTVTDCPLYPDEVYAEGGPTSVSA